jgi:hypothetical protein
MHDLLQIFAARLFIVLGMFYCALKTVKDSHQHLVQISKRVLKIIEKNAALRSIPVCLRHWIWDDIDKELLTREQFLFSGATLHAHVLKTSIRLHSLYDLLKFEQSLITQACLQWRTPALGAPCCVPIKLASITSSKPVTCSVNHLLLDMSYEWLSM